MRKLYLVAAVLGVLFPYRYLVPFLMQHGLNMRLVFEQLFQNNIPAFFGVDVILSSLVLWFFLFSEGKRLGMKHLWVYILCNLAVGVSLALPLFLYFREPKLKT